MTNTKISPDQLSVADYLATVTNPVRLADAKQVIDLISRGSPAHHR